MANRKWNPHWKIERTFDTKRDENFKRILLTTEKGYWGVLPIHGSGHESRWITPQELLAHWHPAERKATDEGDQQMQIVEILWEITKTREQTKVPLLDKKTGEQAVTKKGKLRWQGGPLGDYWASSKRKQGFQSPVHHKGEFWKHAVRLGWDADEAWDYYQQNKDEFHKMLEIIIAEAFHDQPSDSWPLSIEIRDEIPEACFTDVYQASSLTKLLHRVRQHVTKKGKPLPTRTFKVNPQK